MRGTYFEWRGSYSSVLFSSAEVVDGLLSVRCLVWRPFARFVGLPTKLDIPIDDIVSVQIVRHRLSRIKQACVVVAQPSGDERYLFSAWVDAALIAAGAPGLPDERPGREPSNP